MLRQLVLKEARQPAQIEFRPPPPPTLLLLLLVAVLLRTPWRLQRAQQNSEVLWPSDTTVGLLPAGEATRAAQAAGFCAKYIGAAVFGSQFGLDSDPALRRIMLDNESTETGELWRKLHEHKYHCSKQDVSRFKTLRKSGKRRLSPPEEGDLLAKAEAERVAAHKAQAAARQAELQKRAAERAAAEKKRTLRLLLERWD